MSFSFEKQLNVLFYVTAEVHTRAAFVEAPVAAQIRSCIIAKAAVAAQIRSCIKAAPAIQPCSWIQMILLLQ